MRYIVTVLLALSLTGCATIQGWKDASALKKAYGTKAHIEGLIEQTKQEYQAKLDAKDAEIALKTNNFITGLQGQAQFAADALYGADFTFQTIVKPVRTDIIVNNFVNEARAALKVNVSLVAMAKANERVKRELDETRTTMADLQKSHDAALLEAKVASDKADKAAKELEEAKKEKDRIEKEAAAKQHELEVDLNIANNDIISDEHKRADDAKAIQAFKEKASLALGILAVALLAGAIWSPVFKTEMGLLAGCISFAAVAIWYIQPWMIYTAFAVVVLGLIAWAAIKHNKESKAALATYSALNEIKSKSGDLWKNEIAPMLASYQTKYVKTAKGIVEVPDTSIESHIDQVLADAGQLTKPKE
jgi:hypothetical protein